VAVFFPASRPARRRHQITAKRKLKHATSRFAMMARLTATRSLKFGQFALFHRAEECVGVFGLFKGGNAGFAGGTAGCFGFGTFTCDALFWRFEIWVEEG
jgi:hypothetical protein